MKIILSTLYNSSIVHGCILAKVIEDLSQFLRRRKVEIILSLLGKCTLSQLISANAGASGRSIGEHVRIICASIKSYS